MNRVIICVFVAIMAMPVSSFGQIFENKELSEKYPAPVDVAEIPEDAAITQTGVGYRILKENPQGAIPKTFSIVKVNYVSWRNDGTFLFSTLENEPVVVQLFEATPAWREAIRKMKVGEKIRIWAPAYTNASPTGNMLVYDLELLDSYDSVM